MKLNCKEGDLAIVVRSEAGNEGKIVRCLRFRGVMPYVSRDGSRSVVPSWEIDVSLPGWGGEAGNNIEDFRLRPIRGENGDDEMLRIAGNPERLMLTPNFEVSGLAPRKG